MTAIDDKVRDLKQSGFDVGDAVGNEEDVGFGGRRRRFAQADVYWHPNTGAHEVHGNIRKAYDSMGGVDADPTTRRRLFGFPREDETRTADGRYPVSHFEFGNMEWTESGAGAVSGELREQAESMLADADEVGGGMGRLGHSLTPVLIGHLIEYVIFERGCLISVPSKNAVIECSLSLPAIGAPTLVGASPIRMGAAVTWKVVRGELEADFAESRVERAWRGRLKLREVPSGRLIDAELVARRGHFDLVTDAPPESRTLYDIVADGGNVNPAVLAPHGIYCRNEWTSFGLAHATDLHVNRRSDWFAKKLGPQPDEGLDHFINYNDGTRELVRRANALHAEGKLDAIIATGDLVDYVYEDGDNRRGAGNFGFLVDLLRGRGRAPDGQRETELEVPIFMVAGNHDYRVNPYGLYFKLAADVELAHIGIKTMSNFKAHNLLKEEALELQGGKKPNVSLSDAERMVAVKKHIHAMDGVAAQEQPLTVAFGKHRVVLIDSQWDSGILDTSGAILEWVGLGSADERNFAAGHPNSKGFTDEDIDAVRSALVAAGSDGLVMVGLHAPPINTAGNEYPDFLRETNRPTAELADVRAFLVRQAEWTGAKAPGGFVLSDVVPDAVDDAISDVIDDFQFPDGWLDEGQAYVKRGNLKGLDVGVARGSTKEFLMVAAGSEGAARPVDLVLAGHTHKHCEFRWEREGAAGFRVYMDFYTENPRTYYRSKTADGVEHVIVTDRVTAPETSIVREHRSGEEPVTVTQVRTPTYADALEDSSEPRGWWAKHRPLLVQTGATGPISSYQRDTSPLVANPVMRGFRLITVTDDSITSVRHVRFGEESPVTGGGEPGVKVRDHRDKANDDGTVPRAKVRDHRNQADAGSGDGPAKPTRASDKAGPRKSTQVKVVRKPRG